MKHLLSFALILCFGMNLSAVCQSQVDSAEKGRRAVAKIGVDQKTKSEVKLRDSTTIKGYISAINNDSFSFVNEKNGDSRTIKYAEVETIKKRGGLGIGLRD